MDLMQSLGFGTASISSMRSQFEVMQLLNTAFKEGIRHFDTAPLYGRGYAEKLLGSFAKDKRKDLFIATKFGLGPSKLPALSPHVALPLNYYWKKWRSQKPTTPEPLTATAPAKIPYRKISLEYLKNSLQASLHRLQTNYIDFYLLHEALPEFLEPAAFDFLLLQKERGTIRYIGVATNAFNLQTMNQSDCQLWDILQYEAGPHHERLKQLYNDKLHFLHSSILNIRNWSDDPEIPASERGGFLLAKHAKSNVSGKLLFSTRRKNVLHQNILAFKKFSS